MKLLIFLLCIQNLTMIQFDHTKPIEWFTVNDTVMGGISTSSIKVTDANIAVFSGTVSTENNGGFASVRDRANIENLNEYTVAEIKLKGDGKDYQFRIKHEDSDYYSYISTFKTSGKWEMITITLSEMYPAYRGRTLNIPNFDKKSIEEIAFLIGNKRNESFKLEIESITFK